MTNKPRRIKEIFPVNRYHVPEKIDELIDWLIELRKQIPEESRGDARLEFGVEEEYGCHSVEVEAYFYRDETEEELSKRLDKELKRIQLKESSEEALYLKLKEKYGN